MSSMMNWTVRYTRVVTWTAISLFILLVMLLSVEFPKTEPAQTDPPHQNIEPSTTISHSPGPQPIGYFDVHRYE